MTDQNNSQIPAPPDAGQQPVDASVTTPTIPPPPDAHGSIPAPPDAAHKSIPEFERGSDEWYASKLPEGSEKVLSAAKKILVDPFEKLADTFREGGKEVAAGTVATVNDLLHPDYMNAQLQAHAFAPGKHVVETPVETASREHPAVMGASKAVGGFVAGTAGDVRNWPLMASGEALPILRKLMGAGFAAMMSKEAYAGAKNLAENWDNMTPEQRWEIGTETGLGTTMAALATYGTSKETLGDVKSNIQENFKKSLTPESARSKKPAGPPTKTIGGAEVPVRPDTFLAKKAEARAPEVARKFTQEQTAPAVAEGVSKTIQEATGIEGEHALTTEDPFGLASMSETKAKEYQAPVQRIDALADNAFSNAQMERDSVAGDFSEAGKKKWKEANQKLTDLWEEHRSQLESEGMDVDAAKKAWGQKAALDTIEKAMRKTTELSTDPARPYDLKLGKTLGTTIKNLLQHDDAPFQKLFGSKYPEAKTVLEDFARTLSEQSKIAGAGKTPIDAFMTKMSQRIVTDAIGGGIGTFVAGPIGGAIGVAAADLLTTKLADVAAKWYLSKILTTPKAIDLLNTSLKLGADPEIASKHLQTIIHNSDPSWTERTAKYLSDLYQKFIKGTKGEAGLPGSVFEDFEKPSGVPADEMVQAHEKNGGATFDKTGDLSDRDAWSVGAYPERSKILNEGELNSEAIREYEKNNADLLNKENHALGSWKDPETGKTYLDVAKLVSDKDEAVKLAKEKNQKAIYHLKNQEVLDTGGTGEAPSVFSKLQEKYGTTGDPLKAGFIGPDGTMIPLNQEHEVMLRGVGSGDMREEYINKENVIRTRYRMTKKGEEVVFSIPDKVTEEQARQMRNAATKVGRYGNMVIEQAKHGGEFYTTESPSGNAVNEALKKLKAAPEEAAPEAPKQEYSYNPTESNVEHSVVTKDADGRKIGDLVAQDTGNVRDRQITVRSNQVYDVADRGKGYGKNQILSLLNNVDPDVKAVKSDISTTGDAKRVWQSLEKKFPEAITSKIVGKGDSAKTVWTVDMEKFRQSSESRADVAMRQALPETPAIVPRPTANPEAAYRASLGEKEIATRQPNAVSAPSTNDAARLSGIDALNEADKMSPSRTTAAGKPVLGIKQKLVAALADYSDNGISRLLDPTDPDGAIEKFITHAKDNLKWLHNATPEVIRNAAKQWYETAHDTTKNLAEKNEISHEQAAGVTAVLSPQNDWNNNVGQAQRIIEHWKNDQNHAWTPEMDSAFSQIRNGGAVSEPMRRMMDTLRGKKYNQLTAKSPEALLAKKAMWIRVLDEAHNAKDTPIYSPSGGVTGSQTLAWNSIDPMAKALSILENGSVDNIHNTIGFGHKVRNFYNNIINPWSKRGHVTVDTHQVGASLLKPFSGDDIEVQHNFGSGNRAGTPSPAKHAATGVRGSYAVYEEAVRRAASELGIQPRELQSITWEGIRSLMGDDKKTPELRRQVKNIWQAHEAGQLTLDQARDKIVEASGGFSKPSWLSDEEWEKAGGSLEPGQTDFSFGANEGGR